jgi:protein TonB
VDHGIGDVDSGGEEPGGDQPLVPGGDVSYPVLVHRVEPDYPRAAILTRSEGVVILDAIITASGGVEEVQVLKSANVLLDDAAMRAVRQWTYRPATLNGRAVRVRLTVTVRFSIPAA